MCANASHANIQLLQCLCAEQWHSLRIQLVFNSGLFFSLFIVFCILFYTSVGCCFFCVSSFFVPSLASAWSAWLVFKNHFWNIFIFPWWIRQNVFIRKKNRQAACAFRIPTCVLCVSIRLWRGPPDVYMCMCVGFSVDSTFRVSGGDRTTYAISVDSSPKGVEDLLLPSFRMLRTLTTGCAHGLV